MSASGAVSGSPGLRAYPCAFVAALIVALAPGCPSDQPGRRTDPVVGSGAAPAPAAPPCSPAWWRAGAARRERAVARGLRWLEAYVSSRGGCVPGAATRGARDVGCAQGRRSPPLEELLTDAVSPFLEVAVSTPSPALRSQALGTARRLARRVAGLLLRPGALADRDTLFEAIWLLGEAKGLQVRSPRLAAAVLRRLRKTPSADALYDTRTAALAKASEDDVYALLVDAYALEKLRLARPEAVAVPFGLEQVLAFLWRRPYLPHAADRSKDKEIFWDHVYLATHVGYVLADYGRLRLRPGDMPRALSFLRAHAAVALGHDLELAAEVADLLRSAGRDGGRDRFVCAATRRLLTTQNADGSWGRWRRAEDHYDAIHPTWTAVHGLRERRPVAGGAFARRIRAILSRLRARPGSL